jgi:hypothetical protein
MTDASKTTLLRPRWRHPLITLVAGVSLTFWSCGLNESPVQTGEMGNGNFVYHCSYDEYACALHEYEPDIPFNFALGTHFDLGFDLDDEYEQVDYRIDPAAPGIVSNTGGSFSADAVGVVSLLALDRSNEKVLDFVHVVVDTVFDLRIEGTGGAAPPTSLSAGDHVFLLAAPLSSGGAVLMGAMDTWWESSDSEVLALQDPDTGWFDWSDSGGVPGSRVELVAQAPGTAELNVSLPANSLSATLTIRVTEVAQ